MTLLVPVLGLPIALLTLVALPVIGRRILGPIHQAAGSLQAPTRFQLSDFAWLLVQLQIVLAVCAQFVGVETRGYFATLLTFWLFAVTAMWAGAVSFLSRAGVSDPWRRACFILLVLPGTLGIMIGTPFLLGGICFGPLQYFMAVSYGTEDFSWLDIWLGFTLGNSAAAAMLVLGMYLHRLSRWVARGTSVWPGEAVSHAARLRESQLE